jgi:hypothetical protein
VVAVISVFSAKDNFNAARMIARTACPAAAFAAAAFATAAFATAALSPAVFAIAALSKAVQRPMMIFRPRLLRQQDQCQYHEVAIAAFQPIAAAALPNRHGRHKNTKICKAADQASPLLPALHNAAKPMPILTPRRVAGAIHARFDGLHDHFDKSFVTPSLLVSVNL